MKKNLFVKSHMKEIFSNLSKERVEYSVQKREIKYKNS